MISCVSSAAGLSCEIPWLNQTCADTMRAGLGAAGWRRQGKAMGLVPGEQCLLQEGEEGSRQQDQAVLLRTNDGSSVAGGRSLCIFSETLPV